jgi:hypothetical protein
MFGSFRRYFSTDLAIDLGGGQGYRDSARNLQRRDDAGPRLCLEEMTKEEG